MVLAEFFFFNDFLHLFILSNSYLTAYPLKQKYI